MNISDLNLREKDNISLLGNAFLQSLEIVLSSLSEETISVTPSEEAFILEEVFKGPSMSIDTEYVEGFSGKDRMVFKLKDAIPFTQLAMGESIDLEVSELDDLHQSVFSEIVSQVISSTITSLSGNIKKKINFAFPQISVLEKGSILAQDRDSNETIELYYSLKVGNLINSVFLYQIPKEWLNHFEGKIPEEKALPEVAPPAIEHPPSPVEGPADIISASVKENIQPVSESYKEDNSNYSPKKYPSHSEQNLYVGKKDPVNNKNSVRSDNVPVVQPAKFSQLVSAPDKTTPTSLDLFLDVPMKLTAVLGRAVLYLRDVLDMNSGSVFELDRLAGEPIDLMVNNKLVARGEVVVIDEKFGVRVTETMDEVSRRTRIG